MVAAGIPSRRVWVSGLPILDPVFSGSTDKRLVARAGEGRRTHLLFTPSYRPDVSAAPVLSEALIKLCDDHDGHYHITIVPDPVTWESQPGWIAGWRALTAGRDDVTLIEDRGGNVLDLMAETDLLVADLSDMAFLFLAFDKSMILIGDEDAGTRTQYLTPQQIELLKSTAHMITDPAVLEATINLALETDSLNAEQRARIRSVVFESYGDGKASHRIIDKLSEILR